ncbi:MAG: phenylacetic acid degradation protein PaaD, partial [Brevibacterium aurantiacum]|nr:phenylacetic acid degradation protein PaaD [Brevibacterium aurantiacum]
MGEPSPEATTTARTATSADSTSAESGTDSEQLTGAAAMFANDRASQHLGITVDDHGPGWAQCSMTITDIMANGHEITHGGYI